MRELVAKILYSDVLVTQLGLAWVLSEILSPTYNVPCVLWLRVFIQLKLCFRVLAEEGTQPVLIKLLPG